ncbi:uncharacterized protein PV09_03221 [Verruconis gallopava]|uniref:DUF427 domain-containing protein n=1 Tax=Verruconis gallopava TaxID=253628 RepID=A0A0D2AHM8_9PEZI|nr:uncharacterized protein PV09_03221 [Verruconis gallopava]KIW06045.1 hypothetical protein PV09_03221 [Verruconis gallopava]
MSGFSTSYFSTTDLPTLARHLLTHGPRKVLPTPRRVRVLFNRAYIVDTTSALLVWEHDAFPQYYIPKSALRNCIVGTEAIVKLSDGTAGGAILSLRVPDGKAAPEPARATDRVICFYEDEKIAGRLAGLVRLEFGSMDQWFEEDAPIYVHPKDPFKRIDILPSSRQIVVKLLGHTLATANHALHLYETSLPVRYYLPFGSIDTSVLRKSNLVTKCPYKGEAEHFHVVLDGVEHKNLVWLYRIPTAESAAIAGSPCFYNEKVDIYIDGVLQERPKTHFA